MDCLYIRFINLLFNVQCLVNYLHLKTFYLALPLTMVLDKFRRQKAKQQATAEKDDVTKLSSGDMPKFGSPEMRHLFYLGDREEDKSHVFINHGSYGVTPKTVMKKRLTITSSRLIRSIDRI